MGWGLPTAPPVLSPQGPFSWFVPRSLSLALSLYLDKAFCPLNLGPVWAHSPMALNSSSTLRAVLADVSMKKRPLSLAYSDASEASTLRFDARSHLFPARAMTMLGLAARGVKRGLLERGGGGGVGS